MRRAGAGIAALAVFAGGCVMGARVEREVAFAEVTEFDEMQAEPVPIKPLPPAEGVPPGVPGVEVPPFVVTSDLGTIDVDAYAVCWDGPDSTMCADGVPEPARALLAVREELTVSFEPTDNFTAAVSTSIDGDRTMLEWTGVADGWRLNVFPLEPGDYVLWLDWVGAQGDAHAALTLRVMFPG